MLPFLTLTVIDLTAAMPGEDHAEHHPALDQEGPPAPFLTRCMRHVLVLLDFFTSRIAGFCVLLMGAGGGWEGPPHSAEGEAGRGC